MDRNSENEEQVQKVVEELKENRVEATTLGESTLKQTQKLTPKVEEVIQTKPERRVRIVKRTIFFQGNAFEIEEEISVDSDEEESVFTSEDNFDDTKNDQVIKEYNQRLEDRVKEMAPEEIEKIDVLQKFLDQNRPKNHISIFGRDSVYIVASFNDWQPIELKTIWEIKKTKSEGLEIEKWIQK